MNDGNVKTGLNKGILPVQEIQSAIESGMISAATPITDAQLQPASLDLRLGTAVNAWVSFAHVVWELEHGEGLALVHNFPPAILRHGALLGG